MTASHIGIRAFAWDALGNSCSDADLSALSGVVQERRLRRVLELIEAHPSWSVRELALEVRLSPAHLQRLFKQQTGVHVGDLIVEQRLRRAAQLLSETELSVKEIASLTGYGHHSSFVRAFHRRFAQSPSRYRQRSFRAEWSAAEPTEKDGAD